MLYAENDAYSFGLGLLPHSSRGLQWMVGYGAEKDRPSQNRCAPQPTLQILNQNI
jgi:hypothetical protein